MGLHSDARVWKPLSHHSVTVPAGLIRGCVRAPFWRLPLGHFAGATEVVRTPPFICAYDRFCALCTAKILWKISGELESKFIAEKSRRKFGIYMLGTPFVPYS
jgi:hypothetical protein